jgi:hypothetical protein
MLAYLDTLIGFSVVMLVISLLITICTQMGSAMLNHRGSNLLWGLKTLFANINPRQFPKLTGNAEAVAHAVLTHCLISDSWFSGNKVAQAIGRRVPVLHQLVQRYKLAGAIRPTELTEILRHLANNDIAEADPELAAEIHKLLGMTDAAAAAAAAMGQQGVANKINTAVQTLEITVQTVQEEVPKLEDWFNGIMDRVSQKFVVYMRIWTAAFALAFSFGLGLNTIQLMNELYTNGAFRNALVGAGQQALTSAGKVLDAKNSLGAKYVEVLKQALADAGVTPASQPPDSLPTPTEVRVWIQKNVPAAQQPDIQKRFETASLAASQAFVQSSIDDATKVSAIASTAGLDLFQNRWPKKPLWTDYLGVLATAGLLSMGAPFWFNALKTLTNLRPVVASKQEKEQAQATG